METSTDILRVGCYACLRVRFQDRARVAAAPVEAIAERLGLVNEFHAHGGHPNLAIAYLKRVGAAPAQLDDPGLADATAIVHVAARDPAIVTAFETQLTGLLRDSVSIRMLRGSVQPTQYTGTRMQEFAYAQQLLQQPGPLMPNAFVVPLSKTDAWWKKSWMERHTYFLPRYDDAGCMVREGHALAASRGVTSLMRRTYKSECHPAPPDQYEFLNYFECADADVVTFDAVIAALRDVTRNPEWLYVQEGPTWRGRRVAAWSNLFE